MELKIHNLVDSNKCMNAIREMRWKDGLYCPHCDSSDVIKKGKSSKSNGQHRYQCKSCGKRFDDLTGTILSGHHQPLKVWILCLYFMGLNLSNEQIAAELSLSSSDVFDMTTALREGIVKNKPEVELSGIVECDEMYITCGHKGQPEVVKKKDAKAEDTGLDVQEEEELPRKKNHQFSA